jgi:subtilisin family serine protease
VRLRTPTTVATALALALAPTAAGAADTDGFGKDAWWYKAMRIDQAHQTATGKGVTVAVIDGPIDPTVPELRGQDVTPVRNFCGGSPKATGTIASHGTTAVVNIVGNGTGTAPGGVGVAGIAPGARVLAYAVDDDPAAGLQCRTTSVGTALSDAIDAAVADGSRIISMSIGTDRSAPVERTAIERAQAVGVVVVAAIGNAPAATTTDYPAAYPGVVAVAAVDQHAKPWSGNPIGNREAITIAAPGVKMTTGAFIKTRWSSTVAATGTSEATPLVAGSLAVVASKYSKATGNQLIANMIHNPGGTQSFGRTPDLGYGIISLPNMLASDPTQWPDTNPLVEAGVDSAMSTAVPAGGTATAPTARAGDDGGDFPVWIPIAAVVAIAAIAGGVLARRTRLRS